MVASQVEEGQNTAKDTREPSGAVSPWGGGDVGVCMCQNLPGLYKIIVNDETIIKKD